MSDNSHNKPIDKVTFSLALITVLVVSIPLMLFNESVGPIIISLYD
ncbi:MAG: hypothetical protein HOH19_01995 [Kordiimonadaceae bacterium]|nr:hypothetical protein [Kordiimonadaceae bacterium]MBT6031321.1 hypothetical protein [Kordiimonadaceae bacterium]